MSRRQSQNHTTLIYSIIGGVFIIVAIFTPSYYLGLFVNSVFQAFAILPPAPATSNYNFTIEVLRAVLVVFGLLFLIPSILSETGVRKL